MATQPKDDAQIGFDEMPILDDKLENDIAAYFELIEEHRNWTKSRAAIKAAMKDRPEGRYRIGPYILEVKERSGGGLSIPEWTSKVVSVSEA